jgi:hypothetical protein
MRFCFFGALFWLMPPDMTFGHSGLCQPGKSGGRNPYLRWKHPQGGIRICVPLFSYHDVWEKGLCSQTWNPNRSWAWCSSRTWNLDIFRGEGSRRHVWILLILDTCPCRFTDSYVAGGVYSGVWRFLACSVVIDCHKLTIYSVVNWSCDREMPEDSLGSDNSLSGCRNICKRVKQN